LQNAFIVSQRNNAKNSDFKLRTNPFTIVGHPLQQNKTYCSL